MKWLMFLAVSEVMDDRMLKEGKLWPCLGYTTVVPLLLGFVPD